MNITIISGCKYKKIHYGENISNNNILKPIIMKKCKLRRLSETHFTFIFLIMKTMLARYSCKQLELGEMRVA